MEWRGKTVRCCSVAVFDRDIHTRVPSTTCSPPTKANRAQSLAESLPDFRMWESCQTMPLVGGFSRGSPVSPALSFRRCTILTSITLIGSQALAVKSRPDLCASNLLIYEKNTHFAENGNALPSRTVECALGILANKWRMFHMPLNVSTDFAEDIVIVTSVLHNFVRQRDGYNYDDTLTCDGFVDLQDYSFRRVVECWRVGGWERGIVGHEVANKSLMCKGNNCGPAVVSERDWRQPATSHRPVAGKTFVWRLPIAANGKCGSATVGGPKTGVRLATRAFRCHLIRLHMWLPSSNMDTEEIAAVAHLYLATKIKRKRRFCVHPIIMEKMVSSLFYTMYPRIKKDEANFFNFVRMSRTSFDELFDIVRCNLTRHDTTMRSAVTPEEKLICTLRRPRWRHIGIFVRERACDVFQKCQLFEEYWSAVVEWLEDSPPTKVIRARFPAGSSGISHVRIVPGRYRWSAGNLGVLPPSLFIPGAAPSTPHVAPPPPVGSIFLAVESRRNLFTTYVILRLTLVPDKYLAIGCSMTDLHYYFALDRSTVGGIVKEASGFDSRANFPNCLGAIDGKHIRVIQPKHSGSLYYNIKKFFSIVLLAVCDADYTFTYIDIGLYGRTNDSSIFKQAPLYKGMMDNALHIPAPTQMSRTVLVIAPFVFVGDEAFGLSENVLMAERPFLIRRKSTTDCLRVVGTSSAVSRMVDVASHLMMERHRVTRPYTKHISTGRRDPSGSSDSSLGAPSHETTLHRFLVTRDLILASLLMKRKTRKGKCRKLWVHPLLMERPNKGLFHNLFDDLQQDSDKFFSYFRTSKNSFYELLSMIEEGIRKQDTMMTEAIPSDRRLALALSGNLDNIRNQSCMVARNVGQACCSVGCSVS
ncbi:hypothetical protein PR048_010746 [Dryococelus australis]|uniref:DDE Tnp4 domain-containing protein n=1 Tax=Dryococelus australis TaxID=614101 RepID=A0ABQ9I4D8_9NEOP|nr:hypothetical protein PR048_010746 [Dryococelus australis]